MNEIPDIHKPLIRFLRKNNLPYINHRPDVKSGIRSGWPDFSIFLAGRCLFLEAKTANGVVSPKQWLCIADLEKSGNPVKIVRSASEAISAVMEWAGVEKADTEAPESQKEPSVGIGDILSGRTVQNLWIANLAGIDYVFSGDSTAGGLAKLVRRANPHDKIALDKIALPRK